MKNHLIILLVLFAHNLFAQDSKKNSLQLNWGFGNLKRQDITFSPFIHNDWSPVNVSINYKRSSKLEQIATIGYSGYKARIGDEFTYTSFRDSLKSYPTYPHSFTLIQLNYALGKIIHNSNGWVLTLGGRSVNRFNLSSYTFGNNGTFGYYFNLGVDIWLRGSYAFSENQFIETSLFLPVVAYNARSPYLTQDDGFFKDIYSHKGINSFFNYFRRGELQSWNKSQGIDFEISYRKKINDNWSLGVGYAFIMVLNSTPTNYTDIEKKLKICATYNF